MAIRITGLNSGLDTDSIVKELVSAYSVKKDNYVKAQTKLSWKQSAWKSLNTKIYSLYSKISNLRFTDAYSLKKTTVSDTSKANVKAANSAINGSYSLKISEMAKTGYLTGGRLAKGTNEGTTLAKLGYTGGDGSISVTSAGTTTNISVNGDTTISEFVSKLNEAGVKASYDSVNERIYVAAKDTGLENDFSLVGTTSDGVSALSKLGLNIASNANTETYSAWAKYAKNDNGDDYYVLDANGSFTYDTDGKVKTNGTYNEANTQSAIESYLQEIDAAKNDTTTGNEALKAQNESYQTQINAYNRQLQYSGCYEAVQGALGKLSSDGKRADLKELANLSEDALRRTYETDVDGNLLHDADGKLIEATTDSVYTVIASNRLTDLEKEAGLITTSKNEIGEETTDASKATEFVANLQVVSSFEGDTENADIVDAVHAAYDPDDTTAMEKFRTGVTDKRQQVNDHVEANNKKIEENDAVLKKYALISGGESAADLASKVSYATGVTNGTTDLGYNTDASRVNGQDSVIYLNGAMYTSASNTYSINGLTIEALGTTGSDELSIVTATDTQGIYNKLKDFLKDYNELINEMTSLYNASSAKGYEPLTSDEKDAMTDTEVEEWEKKIKDSLLRRDDTLDGVMQAMINSMSKSYEVNGKTFSLSSFGIKTMGILNSAANEGNAYHIDGDADDKLTNSKTDKLMKAINEDPDSLVDFMKQLTSGLYTALDGKMKATTLSSSYTVYNDKQMNTEYSDYTTTIKKWEQKVSDMEDSYYKKFAAMESALAALQSSTSSLSSLFG